LIRKLDLPAKAPLSSSAQAKEPGRPDANANLYRLAAQQRDGSEDLARVFYVSPAVSVRGIQEMITAMRKDARIQKVFSHTAPSAIAVRGNPAQLAQVERIIEEKELSDQRVLGHIRIRESSRPLWTDGLENHRFVVVYFTPGVIVPGLDTTQLRIVAFARWELGDHSESSLC